MASILGLGGSGSQQLNNAPRISRTPIRTARRDNAEGIVDASKRRRQALNSGRTSTMLSGGGAPTGTVGTQNTLG